MNIQEKLLRLQNAAMNEARGEANAIISQHKQAIMNIFEQHKREAQMQADTRIKAEKISAKQQLNMAASKAQLELKRELGSTQKRLKKEIFKETEQLLQEFMKTEDYKHLLVRYIEAAAQFANGEQMTIYINPTDEDKKSFLEEHTGLKLTVSKEDFFGGVRCVIPEKNVLIDHAFKGAEEREYQNFAFKGGTGIE